MDVQISREDLPAFASAFWKEVNGARVFAFHGEMGAGKTTLISAICRSLGVEEGLSSPSYAIINQYAYGRPALRQTLYHIDLYRLRDEEEVIQAGVEDCITSGAICLVEWPERAPGLFDEDTVHVHIQVRSPNERQVQVKIPGRSGESNNNRNL